MPPKKKTDVAARFQDWLRLKKSYMPTTAAVYASSLRYVLSQLGDEITAEQLELVFGVILTNEPTRLGNSRRAWSLFVEYAKAHDTTLPDTPEHEGRVADKENNVGNRLPPHVHVAAANLLRELRIPSRMLKNIKWLHVGEAYELNAASLSGTFHTIQHPDKDQDSWTVPADIIEVLREYAQPNEFGTTPLVPLQPGSHVAYPANLI